MIRYFAMAYGLMQKGKLFVISHVLIAAPEWLVNMELWSDGPGLSGMENPQTTKFKTSIEYRIVRIDGYKLHGVQPPRRQSPDSAG